MTEINHKIIINKAFNNYNIKLWFKSLLFTNDVKQNFIYKHNKTQAKINIKPPIGVIAPSFL